MQVRQTVHIMAAEWRWVIFVGCALILLTFAPLLWVALTGTAEWQFMGALHNYLDGATYISKMVQGYNGNWLIFFQHTPEQYSGAFLQVLYPLLGHIARISAVPPIVMFHVARVGASLFMYVALYHFGATIWTKVRARRVFFITASVGAGFGWLLMPLTLDIRFPDITLAEAFPLFSTYFNVHFPLTTGCLALLAALLVMAFRPGADQDPTIDRLQPAAAVLSVVLALLYPQALVPFGAAAVLYALITWRTERAIPARIVRWLLALILPALPIAAYYVLAVASNEGLAAWNRQNVTETPPPLILIAGFGIPLLIALPGIYRGIRRFERDGDRLILLWLACMVIAIYIPVNIQRRFAVGMMIPIAYFATRAVEDVWLPRISRRQRGFAFALLTVVIAISPIFMLFYPVLPAVLGNPQQAVGIFLERDYALAYRWLDARTSEDDVVLAAPVVGTWLPGWAGAKVVYGHPYETLDAEAKRQAVEAWYAGASNADCAALLDRYDVRYVLYGIEERAFGETACIADLEQVAQFGTVTVYAR